MSDFLEDEAEVSENEDEAPGSDSETEVAREIPKRKKSKAVLEDSSEEEEDGKCT